jgi:hypothetical protein
MARDYATLNPAALGPALELEQGNLVVTHNTGGLTLNRMVRGTVPAFTGQRYFECAFWGAGALLDHVAVGIARGTHSLAKYVGEQSTGYGYKAGNGGIFSNNAQVVACDAAPKEVWIGVLLDLVAGRCTWTVNGSRVASVAVAGGGWYPAVTISGVDAYDLRAAINCGQWWFESPLRVAADNSGPYVQGWYADTLDPEQLRFSPSRARAYCTRATDSLPLVGFDPRITNADSFTIARRAAVWTWGKQNSSTSFGAIEINNEDGAYDSTVGEDRRDQILQAVMVEPGGSYDDGVVLGTAVVDKVDGQGESKITVTLKDTIVRLQRALQRRRFPPWADAGVANTPLPIALGALRNVAAPLERATERRYRLADAPVTNIVKVADKGARLDVHASPPQYTPTNTADGLLLETDAQGLLTVDMSSEGTQVIIPGAADILAGAGAFTAWPNPALPPPGWATGGAISLLVRQGLAQGMPQDYVAALSSTDCYNPAAGRVGAWMRYDTANLLPGKTYRIQFKLVRTTGSTSTGPGYGIMVRSDLTASADGAVSPHAQALQRPQFGTTGESYTFVHKVPAGAARKLYFIAVAAQTAGGLPVGIGGVTFYDVKVELLGEIAADLPLVGIGLQDYAREIFARAGIADSEWVPADCAAIDAATGYTFGVYFDREVTIEQALRAPLDSYCATLFTDQLGRYRFRRLVDPELQSDADIVADWTTNDVVGTITPKVDYAPGLTTQMGARPNQHVFTDSDFVTDTLEVLPAVRTQFKRPCQFIEPTPVTLSPTYRAAAQAPALVSVFDDAALARTEITRVTAPYALDKTQRKVASTAQVPRFFSFSIAYNELGPSLLPFDLSRLTDIRKEPRWGLEAGPKLVVTDIVFNGYSKRFDVTAWGTK